MNLIEVYIGEVTRRLPETTREDIALELRSTIGDMLPDDPTEEEVKETLNELGNPVRMANGFRDWPMHLIGPHYFELYVKLIKIILPIALVVTFIAFITTNIIDYNGTGSIVEVFINLIGDAMGGLWDTAIPVLFWVTIPFVMIERTKLDIPSHLNKWSADDLKKVPYQSKKKRVSRTELFGDLVSAAVFAMLYFNAENLLGIIKNGEVVVPFVHPEVLLSYWPLVSLSFLTAVLLAFYKVMVGFWTKRLAIANAIHQAFATGVIILILMNDQLVHPDFIEFLSISGTYLKVIIAAIAMFFIWNAISDSVKGFRKAKL